jgi:DNA polymerase-3 subunit delta
MLFVIYGIYKSIVVKNTKSLTKKILGDDINDLNFTKIDYTESSLEEIENEISFLPFGYDKKVILIENSEGLLKEKDIENLVKIVNLNDQDVDVILSMNINKINQKFFDDFANKKIIELKELSESDWDKYIVQYLAKRDVKISSEATVELKRRTGQNIESLINEMDKISNYSSTISLEDIKLLVNEPLNENSLELLNYLVENKKELALKTYKDLIIKNNDPVYLISMLSSQLKFLNMVYYLNKTEKKTKDEIASILKVSPGRIYFTLKNLKNLNQKILDNSFEQLYKLDKDIKLGNIDKYVGFELFILNFGG